MKFNNFYDAWKYLNGTEVFWHKDFYKGKFSQEEIGGNFFCNCLFIDVVKVNPINNIISPIKSLNTKTQVWLEAGEPYIDKNVSPDVQFNCHNHDYDSGEDTFEEAIIEMANLVYKQNKK
jgi:hypothetical protein